MQHFLQIIRSQCKQHLLAVHGVQVTEEDLDSFEADYRGSEEESAELVNLYNQFKGNMDLVSHFIASYVGLLNCKSSGQIRVSVLHLQCQ